MKTRIFSILLFILFHFTVRAQSVSALVDTFNEKAYQYYNQYPDSVISYGLQALSYAEKYNYEERRVVSMMRLCKGYGDKGSYETSRSWCNKTIEAADNAHLPRYEASAMLQLAMIEIIETQYYTALNHALNALNLYEKAGDVSGKSMAYLRMGQVYSQTQEFDNAIEMFKKSLEIVEKLHDRKNEAYLNGELGAAHKNKVLNANQGNFRTAIDYYNKAISILSELGDNEVWKTYLSLSNLYAASKGSFNKALEYNRKAFSIVERTENIYGQCMVLTSYATLLNGAGKPEEADAVLVRAQTMASQKPFIDLLISIFYERSLAFSALNQLDSTRVYIQNYSLALKSRFNQTYNRDLNELKIKYESAEKDRNLLALKNEKNQKDLLLEHRQKLLLEQRILTTQKESENDSLTQQNQIKSLQADQSELLRVAAEARASSIRNATIGFSGLAVMLIIGVWLFLYFRRTRREQALKLTFAREKAELETRTLRAQMNPHFIFNALASIKKFILTNDTQSAEAYLSKFARLIRLILENSRETLAPLQSEIELLDNYIQIERLRSGERFDYTFSSDNHPDLENIEIPSLVLQPFVENAIIHGLNNRIEPGGLLTISFKKTPDTLHICIEDNGVGRAQAESLKSPDHRLRHRSFGMDITQKRLETFAAYYGRKPVVIITDLEQANKTAGGTRVEIEIPTDI